GLSPEFPADDNAAASSDQAVAKWLLTLREDGLPKMLECNFLFCRNERLKRSFRDASEPVNFIIRLRSFAGIELFELKNNLTGERLTLQQIDNLFLVRCPIRREEAKWAKWEQEAIAWNFDNQWNQIDINFKDADIGDGQENETVANCRFRL
uniref:PH domain-containing protein n=1 Tax=Globodera pallida TaxID=36090 RepID=A0A183CQZ9_GLOPA